jgi:hypothetical protein
LTAPPRREEDGPRSTREVPRTRQARRRRTRLEEADDAHDVFTTARSGEAKPVDVPARDRPLDPHTVAALDRDQAGWEVIA